MSSFSVAVKHISAGKDYGAAAYFQNMQVRAALYKVAFCAMIFALLFWCSDVFSETPDSTLEVAETALAKLDATNLDDDWYFSMQLVEEDELRIIRSDPHGDKYEKRQLLSIDGVTPDANRQNEFRESEVKRMDELDADAAG